MRHDKKVEDGRMRLILLERIGRAVIRDDAPLADIEAAIAACCA
jgi:3-dehydroquinate synthase